MIVGCLGVQKAKVDKFNKAREILKGPKNK